MQDMVSPQFCINLQEYFIAVCLLHVYKYLHLVTLHNSIQGKSTSTKINFMEDALSLLWAGVRDKGYS